MVLQLPTLPPTLVMKLKLSSYFCKKKLGKCMKGDIIKESLTYCIYCFFPFVRQVFELRSSEEMTEEWLKAKLKFFT